MGFEWFLVVDLCKGTSLYKYLQKRSCKPGKEIVDDTPPRPGHDDDPFGLGGLVAGMDEMVKTITGETEEVESDVEEGDRYGLSEDEVKKIMLQILSCVNYLHKNRLVHAGTVKKQSTGPSLDNS
jgi:serine/threonine protein kinase